MTSPIDTEKFALHEAHVGVEFVRFTLPGHQVGSGPVQIEIGLPYEAVKIGNQRWIVAVISTGTFHFPGEEEVNAERTSC